MAKSLALNESIGDVVDIDNIIESEEEESARRQSLGRVGFSVGMMYPMFDSYANRNYETDWDYSSSTFGEETNTTTYDSQKIKISGKLNTQETRKKQ